MRLSSGVVQPLWLRRMIMNRWTMSRSYSSSPDRSEMITFTSRLTAGGSVGGFVFGMTSTIRQPFSCSAGPMYFLDQVRVLLRHQQVFLALAKLLSEGTRQRYLYRLVII